MAIQGLHHVHLLVPDIEASKAFVMDFGLVPVSEANERAYFRTSGTLAYSVVIERADASGLGSIAFSVDSRDDLEDAIRLHGASAITALDGPAGGEQVMLTDPDGKTIYLVHGVSTGNAEPLRAAMIVNYGHDKPRKGSSQQLAALQPAKLLRLGHIGLFARDMAACVEWYQRVLKLLPSDLMYAGAPQNVVAGFFRINRGDEWVDHHTIALFGMGKSDLHHISFEVQDTEVQFMAHRWLNKQGHNLIWGVGRHPKGSHIFDVWRDPSGYRFETFSDTDLCTADRKPDVFPVQEAEMDMWSDQDVSTYFA